jgi:hypothetical protein
MFLMNIDMYMFLATTHFSDYSWSCEAHQIRTYRAITQLGTKLKQE